MGNNVFNAIMREFKIPSDRQLAAVLGVSPPHICKIRQGKLTFGPVMILKTHDATDWPIKRIKELLCAI